MTPGFRFMSDVAWFRFEGVICTRSALSSAAWMAARHHDLLGRAGGLGLSWLGRGVSGLGDPEAALRLAWRGLAGASEDRVHVLSEDLGDLLLDEALNPTGVALLRHVRDDGMVPVLVATHPDLVVQRVAAHLGVDHVLANRLELEDGRATGRLVEPVRTGPIDRRRLDDEAHALGLTTDHARAYGHGPEDTALLASAPRPCAVTPSPRLRRLAHQLGWPVVEARP